jgi:hypothetical protein
MTRFWYTLKNLDPFAMFDSIDFYLQLVWTIVHRLCDDVCNFEREKTMLAI